MILAWILLLPLAGGVIAFLTRRISSTASFYAPVAALAIDTLLLVWMWGWKAGAGNNPWIAEWAVPWVPQLGMQFALAMDGLSLVMTLLTCIVALVTALTFRGLDRKDPGLHTLLFTLSITAIIGVFLAADIMLFFISFEVMLLPAFAMIMHWGTGPRRRAAMGMFIYTQAGGLLMLAAILGLYAMHAQATGVQSFAIRDLLDTPLEPALATLFLLGFLVVFAIKLPVVPFHTWQPLAYESAPIETTIVLSALMAKTAGYGLLRYAIPLFPAAALDFAPWAMAFGVVSIFYASWVAYGQTDLKRFIAYSSAAHLGYVVLGAFAMNDLGQRGAIVQMFCHGISVAGLFLVADLIERRTGTRDIGKLGGLWHDEPRLGAVALVFTMATLGLPGLGNFIGEFMTLAGAYQASPLIGGIAAAGAVLSAAYSLRFVQLVFFGPKRDVPPGGKPSPLVLAISGVLIAVLVFVGFYPQPLIDAARTAPAAAGTVVADDAPAGERP